MGTLDHEFWMFRYQFEPGSTVYFELARPEAPPPTGPPRPSQILAEATVSASGEYLILPAMFRAAGRAGGNRSGGIRYAAVGQAPGGAWKRVFFHNAPSHTEPGWFTAA